MAKKEKLPINKTFFENISKLYIMKNNIEIFSDAYYAVSGFARFIDQSLNEEGGEEETQVIKKEELV